MSASSLFQAPASGADRSAVSAAELPVFHARGLTKTYLMGEVTVPALQSVDLDLFPRELVVILGPSGSGKSTLLNILGGLDSPTSGDVRFRDHDLVAANDRELTRYRREHVGFVFQFYNLIPSLTARENVTLVTELSGDPMRAEDRPPGSGNAHRRQRRGRHDDGHHHAQCGDRGRRGSGAAHGQRPDRRDDAERAACRSRDAGVVTDDAHAGSQADAGAPAPLGPDRLDRARDGLRHDDDHGAARHADVDSRSARRVLRRPSVCRSLRTCRAGAVHARGAAGGDSGHRRAGDAHRARRAPRRAVAAGAGDRPHGEHSRCAAADAQRRTGAARTLARRRLGERGPDQRTLRRGQWTRRGRRYRGGGERTSAARDHRGHRDLAGVRRGAGEQRGLRGQPSLRDRVGDAPHDGRRLRHEGRVQRCRRPIGRRRERVGGDAAPRRAARALGGTPAYGRRDQPAARALEDEFNQLRTNATFFPLFFLFVAAFLLDVVLSRVVASQRDEIAALKAFGYTDREIGWHYLGFGVAAVVVGAAVGIPAGVWMGARFTGLYHDYFRFPSIPSRVDWTAATAAVGISSAFALLGTLSGVRRVMKLTPAEALRPESPSRFRPEEASRAGAERCRAAEADAAQARAALAGQRRNTATLLVVRAPAAGRVASA